LGGKQKKANWKKGTRPRRKKLLTEKNLKGKKKKGSPFKRKTSSRKGEIQVFGPKEYNRKKGGPFLPGSARTRRSENHFILRGKKSPFLVRAREAKQDGEGNWSKKRGRTFPFLCKIDDGERSLPKIQRRKKKKGGKPRKGKGELPPALQKKKKRTARQR